MSATFSPLSISPKKFKKKIRFQKRELEVSDLNYLPISIKRSSDAEAKSFPSCENEIVRTGQSKRENTLIQANSCKYIEKFIKKLYNVELQFTHIDVPN